MEKLNDLCKAIKKFEGFNFSDDMILDCATRILNSRNIQEEKVNKAKENFPKDIKPATEGQLKALDKFRIKYPASISKQEAMKLIDERIKRINASKENTKQDIDY